MIQAGVLEDLHALAEAGRRCDELSERLRDEIAERDALVRKLTSAGFTRREVAEAARLTPGRVQQIVGDADPPDPPLDPGPQRLQALERANRIRLARRELKRRIAEGECSVAEVVLDPPVEAISWAIGELLMSQRRWGSTRCRKFLAAHHITETKSLGALTDRQRRLIADALQSPDRTLDLIQI